MQEEFPPKWREQLISNYVKLGASRADSELTVDLAINSVDKAFDSWGIVLKTAPSLMIVKNATSLAIQLLSMRAQEIAENLLGGIDHSDGKTLTAMLNTADID